MTDWWFKVVVALLSAQGAISRTTGIKLEEGCQVTQFSQVQVAVEICDYIIFDNLFVPGGRTLNLQLRNNATVYFRGNITFGYAEWSGPLVAINATDVVIEGEDEAVFNGQGQLYWDGLGKWGSVKPIFFVMQLHNSVVRNIYILNAPQHNAILADSTNVQLSGWIADASAGAESAGNKSGHNTDGFVIENSTNVVLQNCVVSNQDDCVVVRSGANILVDDFICSGSHGLSVSAGFSSDNEELNTVRNVTFSNSILSGGENAIHVKTHVDGGFGKIENIIYKHIEFTGPSNYGINIQQNYRDLPPNGIMPDSPRNNIPITGLQLINIVGSVDSSAVPIYILCAEEGCFDWEFKQVLVTGTEKSMCNYMPNGFSC